MITRSSPRRDTPFALLDVAGGTAISHFAPAAGSGFGHVCDSNAICWMLAAARGAGISTTGNHLLKAMPKRWLSLTQFRRLYDCVRHPQRAADRSCTNEAFRVLKLAAGFFVWNSRRRCSRLDRIYDCFSFRLIPPLGRA